MMRKFLFASLLMLFVVGTASAQQSAPAITLERTACRGTCPVYTITILEDGTVIYEGEAHVAVTGEQTSELDPDTVASMVEAFANAGYFDWDESYEEQTVTDLPNVNTSVTRSGETHQITRYVGDSSAPLALPFLEQWIDEMTSSQLWTGIQPDPGAISNGTDTPLITLQRSPCFGDCPVYNVALYEDGTVAYTGITNTDLFGVHTFEADPAAIASIAQIAQITGYFDWQESYDESVVTDQSTVTTSIRWEDQSKRIVRYEGDPNAPVGLTWIEDDIDRLVSSLMA